jgi:hypothetical protein
MQLEHVYGQILLTLTEQVQSVFVQIQILILLNCLGRVDAQLVGSCDRDTESRDNKLM